MESQITCHARRGIIGIAVLLVLAMAGSACASKSSSANVTSQFLSELKKETYPETTAPATAPVFRWDFTNKDVHNYSFEQEARMKTDMGSFGGECGDSGQDMSAKGALMIKSQGDGTADLVLKDVKMTMKMNWGKGKEPKTMEQAAPPMVVQGLKEDGSGSFGNSSQDMLLKMLFPLPTKSLKVGDWVDVPAQMPFNAMGSLLQVKGRSRVTLTRYVNIEDRTCAQLDVDTDISDLKVPSELKGDYECSTRAASVSYFDVGSRLFVSGAIALITEFSVDAPAPQMKMPGEDIPEMPERVKMSMMGDNLIRVKLKE